MGKKAPKEIRKMARNLLSNKFVFAAVVLAFALAVGASASFGFAPSQERVLTSQAAANDPTNPCDPWGGCIAAANDPTNPCDPWGGCVTSTSQKSLVATADANDPTNPCDPWGGCIANDPTNPCDPWGGCVTSTSQKSLVATAKANDPTNPCDPWGGCSVARRFSRTA